MEGSGVVDCLTKPFCVSYWDEWYFPISFFDSHYLFLWSGMFIDAICDGCAFADG